MRWGRTAGEGDFVGIEESSQGVLGDFETVGEDSRVDSFGSVTEGLR